VTEADWDACADPTPMLDFLRGKASDRKLRLFAVACTRLRLSRSADEQPDLKFMLASLDKAEALAESRRPPEPGPPVSPGSRCRQLVWIWMVDDAAEAARDCALPDRATDLGPLFLTDGAAFLRCFFPNPFRPAPALDPAWFAWNYGTVAKLAAAIYNERRFADLPILADALEDAGCADAAILAHCRGGGEHARGCWVVDLFLGKA
jgi:hypothetical protein